MSQKKKLSKAAHAASAQIAEEKRVSRAVSIISPKETAATLFVLMICVAILCVYIIFGDAILGAIKAAFSTPNITTPAVK